MRQLWQLRDFRQLWLGFSVSSLGTWISYIALNLYVYHVFGSASVLGSFLAVRLVPALFFGPLGGYLADRFSRRRLLIACDVLRAMLVWGYAWAGELWVFFVLGLLIACLDKIYQAVQAAFIPDLLPQDRLMEGNALMRMSSSAATALGPALGALLVTAYGYTAAFAIDAASFALSALCMVFISAQALGEISQSRRGAGRDFGLVGRTMWALPVLMLLVLLRFADALGSGAYTTGMPLLAKLISEDGKQCYGWMVGIWALGTLLGAYLWGRLCRRWQLNQTRCFIISVGAMAVLMGASFQTLQLPWVLALLFGGGLADGVSGLIFQTELMRLAPPDIRGKLLGSTFALINTGSLLGMAGAGPLLDTLAVSRLTLWTSAAMFLCAAGAGLWQLRSGERG